MGEFMTTLSNQARNQIVRATGGVQRLAGQLAEQGQQWIQANENDWNDMLVDMGIRVRISLRDLLGAVLIH